MEFKLPPILAPAPRKFEINPGQWILPEKIVVAVDNQFSSNLQPALDDFREAMKRLKNIDFIFNGKTQPHLSIRHSQTDISDQGYSLDINEGGIAISARGEAGAFYGLQTVQQILLQCENKIPFVTIGDWPEITEPGFMLDISRCKVPRMETLLDLIRMLASFKINQLQLYTEHTFAFTNHEVVWGDASPLTADEVRELDEYCRQRFIEMVPNLNSFGHFERWLRHPEYKHLAECPDGFTMPGGKSSEWGLTLYPGPESLRFVEKLYEEFLPNFSSPRINAGCDETWELGQGRSRSLVEKAGGGEVYYGFLLKIANLARKNGKQIQFWADWVLRNPENIKRLEDDITGVIWGYEADHPFDEQCEIFAQAGRDFYVAPGTSSWNSIGGCLDNAVQNLLSAADSAAKFGASGYLITDWGDYGHHQSLPVSYAPIIFGASQAWNHEISNADKLGEILNRFVFHDDSGITDKLWVEIGQTPGKLKKSPHNSSPLNKLLFSDGTTLDDILDGIGLEELSNTCSRLLRLEVEIPSARPTCRDGEKVLAELRLTLAMLLHATRRGIAHLSGSTVDFTQRRREMILLIHQYEECWLARNRHGGLHESSNILRDALKSYT